MPTQVHHRVPTTSSTIHLTCCRRSLIGRVIQKTTPARSCITKNRAWMCCSWLICPLELSPTWRMSKNDNPNDTDVAIERSNKPHIFANRKADDFLYTHKFMYNQFCSTMSWDHVCPQSLERHFKPTPCTLVILISVLLLDSTCVHWLVHNTGMNGVIDSDLSNLFTSFAINDEALFIVKFEKHRIKI
jgi:hypothetical protein